MNIRPVRLAPCAAGARPTINRRACGSPKPGTGRPQYFSSLYAARFSRAIFSRHSTSLGHLRHRVTSASSSARTISFEVLSINGQVPQSGHSLDRIGRVAVRNRRPTTSRPYALDLRTAADPMRIRASWSASRLVSAPARARALLGGTRSPVCS